jgi:DNA-binding transcriptional ArsR family regulator
VDFALETERQRDCTPAEAILEAAQLRPGMRVLDLACGVGDPALSIAAEPRRRILNHLAGGPMTVGEIAAKFDMATPSISKHLSVLKEAGLVHEQKRGQFVIYSISADNLTNILYQFLAPFCPQARKIAIQRKRERKDK